MRTRKTKDTGSSEDVPGIATGDSVPRQDPVKLLLLPSNASAEARICTLPHPATSKPCRYFCCPENGIYEFKRISVPKRDCRSWLLGRKVVAKSRGNGDETGPTEQSDTLYESAPSCANETDQLEDTDSTRSISQGHTIKEPELFIATPMDPLFLILPSLYAQTQKSAKGLLLSLDNLLENVYDSSGHLELVMRSDKMQQMVKARTAAVCDTVNAEDEKMYRLDTGRLLAEILGKAQRMASNGLPGSMEAKFITKALEAPVMSLKREESSLSQSGNDTLSGHDSQSDSTAESQPSTVTEKSVISDISAQTEVTIPDPPGPAPAAPENIRNLLRLRTTLHFILTAYLPASLAATIKTMIASPSFVVDFTPLDAHLALLTKLRAEAQASRSLSDFSRKRNTIDDEEAAEEKAEKRRKKEQEDKVQKGRETKAMRDLKKVDVKGMKKMSDFFGKSAAGKKSG
ncbi:MAG: hypothetical protein L6R39_002505 [Caloplaca ligustica]|nr:MAG: hypothetical protein L6R39_002505 [Caloplaca ligustica]